MGLKSMLQNKELKEILKPILPSKYAFTTNLGWEIDAFSKHYTLLVPNELTNKSDARLVGIAFDYMARFIIASHIKNNKKSVLQDMVCEKAFHILKNVLADDELHIYKMLYKEAIIKIEDYIMNISNSYYILIPYAFLLARLEQVMRVYPMVEASSILNYENTKDMELEEDLKKNCEVFENVFIRSGLVSKDSFVVFNPHFGIWSHKCFGADADIFIDGILYDFKCTTKNGYRSEDVAQICGYYLLHRLSKTTDNEGYEELAPLKDIDINAIALYKSRYGTIERYDIAKFDKRKLEEVIEQVRIFIDKYYYYNNIININNLWQEYLKNKDH